MLNLLEELSLIPGCEVRLSWSPWDKRWRAGIEVSGSNHLALTSTDTTPEAVIRALYGQVMVIRKAGIEAVAPPALTYEAPAEEPF